MRIQHNIMAMSSYRNYTNNVSAMKGNLEKLSSGYKINRAGDDAAGLAISEKMRAQITGLKQAQANAKSGINLVQTAEGALQEVQDMMNRMVKLAEQSANGTYDDGVDRNQLQKEFLQLKDEINRINKSANFNGIDLFGGPEDAGAAAPTTTAPTVTGKFGGADVAKTETAAKPASNAVYSFTPPVFNATNDSKVEIAGVELTIGTDNTADLDTTSGTGNADTAAKTGAAIADKLNADNTFKAKYTAEADATTGKITITAKTAGVDTKPTINVTANGGNTPTAAPTVDEDTKGAAAVAASTTYDLSKTPAAGDKITIDGKEYEFKADSDGSDGKTFKDLASLKTAAGKNGVTLDITTPAKVTASKAAAEADDADTGDTTTTTGATPLGSLNIQIGDTGADYNKMAINRYSISSASIFDISEGTGKKLDDLSVADEDSAREALSALKGMVNYISDIRGELGAKQNRLSHTINNLSVMEENIQDAESTIRDTDVADEMMAYTKNNILIQSAQAMLAQANQVPQGVLQLLQ